MPPKGMKNHYAHLCECRIEAEVMARTKPKRKPTKGPNYLTKSAAAGTKKRPKILAQKIAKGLGVNDSKNPSRCTIFLVFQ
jgi:hypothetical protein